MDVKIEQGWKNALADEWNKDYFARLVAFVKEQYRTGRVYPEPRRMFAAFDACPYDDVKVVIIGQDPYHGAGQADGLCFSVRPGVAKPPSLVNIFKEMSSDLGTGRIPTDGTLDYLATEGVLLLNSTLTVQEGRPASHAGHGWETFTDAVVDILNRRKSHLVFILWGAYAINKGRMIDRSRHLVLEAPHPSPLSAHRGFFGCRHFSKTNSYLISQGLTPIKWLPES